MTEPNPITPPPELVREWAQMQPAEQVVADHWQHLCTQAARWAADAELEACIQLMLDKGWITQSFAENLRAARRPKQPSLKEQALKALEHLSGWDGDADTIRRALELVPDDPAVTPAAEPAAAPDRPLWDLMHAAYCAAVGMGVSSYAAELRVVADWLERRWPQGPDMHPCVCAAWLRAEAERAEAGES